MQASKTFQVVVRNFHPCSTPTLKVLNIKSRNKAPCKGPIKREPEGLLNMYFIGMAINSNNNREMPSSMPTIRNRPVLVCNK